MYIITTSKAGAFQAIPGAGVTIVETWRYLFYGKERAVYAICEIIDPEARIDIVDADDDRCVNSLPNKFFGAFDDIETAREEIRTLTNFSDLDARLERVE